MFRFAWEAAPGYYGDVLPLSNLMKPCLVPFYSSEKIIYG